MLSADCYDRLEVEVSRYNDIATIMKKLRENGMLNAIYELMLSVFANEHDFTVKMLNQMIASKPNSQFNFNSLYNINAKIFANNFKLINSIIIDDIFTQFSVHPNINNNNQEPYSQQVNQEDINQNHNNQPNSSRQASPRQNNSLSKESEGRMALKNLSQNMNYIMAHHPEIDSVPSRKPTPKSNSVHVSAPTQNKNNNYEYEESQQNQRQMRSPSNHSLPASQQQQQPPINDMQYLPSAPQQFQVVASSSSSSFYRNNSQPKFYQENLIANAAKYSHSPPSVISSQQQISSSQSKNRSSLKISSKSMHSSYHYSNNNQSSTLLNQNNIPSPSRGSQTSTNKLQSSVSRLSEWQASIIDSSQISKVYLPYSEFSYTKGGSFTKSQRKLHDIADNPGVGEYDAILGKKASAVSFGKQEKRTIFDQKIDRKPEMYYPSYNYISKPPQTIKH